MSGANGSGGALDAVVSLSVHGPAGVVDLQVPAGASGADVALEYSRVASVPRAPLLYTRLGRPLDSDATLAQSGIRSGALLVAVAPDGPPLARRRQVRMGNALGALGTHGLRPGALSRVWLAIAVASSLLGAATALGLPDGTRRTWIVVLLGGAALVGALPLGGLRAQRAHAVPAIAGAAAAVLVWDPEPVRLPTVIGIAALIAALAAAVVRALDGGPDEGLRVWIWTGVLVFCLTTLAAVIGLAPACCWSVLLVAAMLAVRFVPMLAVDVPDQYLLDLERLAVTAWSARERPQRRRGRIIVPREAVAAVAASAERLTTAACVAIAAITVPASVLLLAATPVTVDHVGARVVVGCAGSAVLLSARTFRHAPARTLLRVAGVGALVVLVLDLLPDAAAGLVATLGYVCMAAGAGCVLVAVALGRGWRSLWWSRRAEVAESVAASGALGFVVVSCGLVRGLWELIG